MEQVQENKATDFAESVIAVVELLSSTGKSYRKKIYKSCSQKSN